jgi:hypothetical protein
MVGELSVNRRTCQLLIAVRTAGSDQLGQRVAAPRDQGLGRSDHLAMEDLSGRARERAVPRLAKPLVRKVQAPTLILEELAPEQIIEVLSHFELFKAERLRNEGRPELASDPAEVG